jgi:hypothetical protein
MQQVEAALLTSPVQLVSHVNRGQNEGKCHDTSLKKIRWKIESQEGLQNIT